jgi:hypothetical protein
MTPAVGLLLVGGILLVAGFQNRNIVDVILGRDTPGDPKGKVPDVSTTTAVPGGTGGTPSPGGIVAGTSGRGTYAALRKAMERIAALNLPYKWGGGHMPGYGSPNGPFDCSGATSYALHEAGFYNGPPLTSGLFMAWGSPGRGKEFTVYCNPTHVFIRDEVTGQDWGTTTTTGKGGPAFHHHGTTGFVARHVEGH